MSRKLLLWLLLLLLGVVIFFCVKSKIADIAPKIQQVKPVVVVKEKKVEIKSPEVKPVKVVKPVVKEVKKEVKKEKTKPKDISLKIEKSKDSLSINGILNSKSDFKNISSKYPNLKNQGLKFDKQYSNPKITNLIMSLSDTVKKLKNGFVEYHDKTLIVDGIVSSKEDKDAIDGAISSISDMKVSSNIIVEEPKPTVKHIGKLSITKEGNNVTVSGIFSSENELDSLIKLLSDKGLNVKKELCVVDSDLNEDRWKIPTVKILDDFLKLNKGVIQFDKDTFSVIGDTNVKGIKEDISKKLVQDDDSVILTSDITYIAPKPTKEQVQEKVNSILKLKNIRFKTATDVLIPESKTVLDEVAKTLLSNPNIKVKIAGHTDSDGSKNKNLILSQKRADTVREYLIKKGVNPDNLKAVGYGESKPLVKNNSKANKQINRRVEFIIIGD